MSHNTFGHLFRVTTWGESHGPAIGCVIDGCPPRIPLAAAEIQAALDRRRPGRSRFTTQRREPDEVRILSGVFEDDATGGTVTTGTPVSLLIENIDQRSKDYSEIRERWRPGHADYTYDAKYGIRDYRGGGRSSARETAMRVAAGAIARKVVGGGTIRGAPVQNGPQAIDRGDWGWAGARRPSLRQARLRPRGGADVDQCREGRRDRRGVCRRGPAGRGECRRDAARQRGRAEFPVQPCRRRPRRHLDGAAGGVPFRGQADLVDPDPTRERHTDGRRHGRGHQGAPRPLRRDPRGSGRRGHGGVRARRSLAAPPRPGRRGAGLAARLIKGARAILVLLK